MVNLNPLVYVKLVCHQCSQKYAFDVLPVDNQMPVSVKCPVCHTDGTHAANLFLAQKSMGIAPPAAIAPGVQSVPAIVKVPSVYDVPTVQSSLPTIGADSTSAVSEAEWRRRALEAEARAEQVQAALKAGLAESLKEVVVQGLAAQRSELLNVQQSAAFEITELVNRLDELKAPMQERLHSYEERIQELERDLAERTEENRELLKMKIEMTRHQLEAERVHNRVGFN